MLILDEPTSALDARTEAEIVATLRRLQPQRTVITIAHRISTVRHADQIAVLDDGRVLERGSHHELLARGGVYASYHARQVAGAGVGSAGGHDAGPEASAPAPEERS